MADLEIGSKLKKCIEVACNSEQLDEVAIKNVKKLCRQVQIRIQIQTYIHKIIQILNQGDAQVTTSCALLLKQLGRPHSVVRFVVCFVCVVTCTNVYQQHARLRCVELADSLFHRSHHFRTLLLRDLELFLRLALGNEVKPINLVLIFLLLILLLLLLLLLFLLLNMM